MTYVVGGFRRAAHLLVAAGIAALALTYIVRLEQTPTPDAELAAEFVATGSPTYGDRSYSIGPPQPLHPDARVYAQSRDKGGSDRLMLFETDQRPSVLFRTEPGQAIRQLRVPAENILMVAVFDGSSEQLVHLRSCDGGRTWDEVVDRSNNGGPRNEARRGQCLDFASPGLAPDATPAESLVFVDARRGYVVDYFLSGNHQGTISWFEGNRGFVSLLDDGNKPVRPWSIGRFRTVRVSGSVITGDWCPEPLAFAGGKLQGDPCHLVHFDTDTGEVRHVALNGVKGLERGLGFTLLWLD